MDSHAANKKDDSGDYIITWENTHRISLYEKKNTVL